MSGPKCSSYEIAAAERRRQEAERQKRLEEERKRLEELKCQSLEETITALLRKLDKCKSDIKSTADSKVIDAKGLLSESHGIDNLERSARRMLQSIEAFPRRYGVRNSREMELYMRTLSKFMEEVEGYQDSVFREALELLNGEMREYRIGAAEKDFLSKSHSSAKRKKVSLQAPTAQQTPKQQEESHLVEIALANFQLLLQPYLGNDFLVKRKEVEELLSSAKRIADSKELDSGYKVSQIKMRTKAFLQTKVKYDEEIALHQQQYSEFNQLHSTYLALCTLLAEEPHKYVFDVARSFQIVDELRQAVALKNGELARKEEADYISQSINEVMSELGYEIVASDFMTTPQKSIIHNAYEFERGNVINAFTSDNGSLMFEITGVKEEGHELTFQERLEITESMESFCTKYPEIKEMLKSKGIELKFEDLKPPDARYARAFDLREAGKPAEKLRRRTTAASRKNKSLYSA